MRPLWLLGSLLWLVPVSAQAARTVTVDQPLVVRLEFQQQTAVTYPESIRDVIMPWSADDIKEKAVGPHLYLMPKWPELTGRFFVVGESGRQYPGTFKVASPADDTVVVTLSTAQTTSKPVPFSPASLLRALRRPPAKPLPGQQPLQLATPLIEDPRVALVSMTAIRVGDWVGMTLALRNTQPMPLILDVRLGVTTAVADDVVAVSTFVWPPLLEPVVLAAEQEQMVPGVETQLYLVFERKEPQSVR